MKKKLVAVFLSAVMAVSLLAGCGGGGGEAGSRTMDVEGETTELEVWTFVELHQDFYVNMAEKWNAENPDKKVKLTLSNLGYDDMHNKLSLALETGKGAPDAVDIEIGKFPAFMVGDVGLKDLSSAIEPYKDTTIQSRLDIYSKGGEYYGLPTHVGATAAFYNEELLSEAGVDYKAIKTWDDFKEAGVKYHEATGKMFACVETSALWTLNLMVAQRGGDYVDESGKVDLTSKEIQESLEFFKSLQETGAFGVIPGGQPDNDEAYPLFNSGDYAAQIMPFWQTSRFLSYMTDLDGKIAIAAPPALEGGAVQSIGGGGTGTAIIKSSENADLAAEVFAFIKLSEEANVDVWNVLGFDPVNTDVWADTAVTQNPENKFVAYFATYPFDALNEMKDGIGALDIFTNETWPSINSIFSTTTLNNIFESDMDISEALAEAQETLDNEFQ